MDNFTQFLHPLQNETSTKTCLDRRIEFDNSTQVKLGVRSWGSSHITNAILAILIQEVLGVKANILDFHQVYADFAQTYGSEIEAIADWSYYMREGYVDADAENWQRYVGKTGWYITSEMLAIQRDLNSYAAYRYPETASLFNPNKTIAELLNSTSNGISINVTNAIENNINSAYCNDTSPQFSVQNCLNATLYYAAEYQNSSKALGIFHSPGSDWSPRDDQIIANLGLKLKLEVLGDPIEQNILDTLKQRHAEGRPWIGYMYSPHSIFFSNKSGISLTNEECEAKLEDGFVRSDLYNYSKPVANLIEKFKLNELEMTQMLALMAYDNMSAYDVACCIYLLFFSMEVISVCLTAPGSRLSCWY
ncbi:hypothetical protein BKA69DRAFT_1089543 [Paraphysoderma sedebokerense]|nr:hypothetical protein BKA69DRAFT_1089543 [Paraphysoderma sedebokerense]